MNNEFFEALADLGTENSVDAEIMIEKVKIAMQKAAQRIYPDCKESIRVDIDPEKKIFNVALMQEVVEEDPINASQIHIDVARTIDPGAYVGMIIEKPLDISKFGRASAQSAKQSIKGDLRDINRDRLLEKFKDKENDILTAVITQIEPNGAATLMYDKTELYLLRQEQIPGEVLREGMSIKVYVTGIANKSKKPVIKVSRVHRDLVKRLFELEVPEIFDGTVEVKAISREAGSRSKIAVVSHDQNVDAIGSCIGPKRSRISAIVRELGGEKIDIIPYSEDPAEFIAHALSPAKVLSVTILDEEEHTCMAVVPNDQLSLAIGNRGQNAKLAAKLTGFKIDIKSDMDTEAIAAAAEQAKPAEETEPAETEETVSETVSEETAE